MNDWTPEKIKQLRAKLGLTQAGFADKVGVTPNYVYLLENGRKHPGKTLSILFNYLDREINEKGGKENG